MPYKVFISHSMNQDDLGLVYETARRAEVNGISCYIAERDWQFGSSLPAKIEQGIRSSDHFVAFWTRGGSHSQFVNQEIGFARAVGKPRILVVEKGEPVKGFDIDKEYVEFDRMNPTQAIADLNDFLAQRKLAKEKFEEQKKAWVFVFGIVGLLFLLGSGEK